MKKLFFAALVATVAVGGAAFAQQYSTLPNGNGVLFDCTIQDEPTCTQIVGSEAYVYPTSETAELPSDRFYEEI